MKAYEILEELFALADERDCSGTCDTLKAGNPNAEVQKVAVSMFATIDVVKRAKAMRRSSVIKKRCSLWDISALSETV